MSFLAIIQNKNEFTYKRRDFIYTHRNIKTAFACIDTRLFIHRLIITVHLGFIHIHRCRGIQPCANATRQAATFLLRVVFVGGLFGVFEQKKKGK